MSGPYQADTRPGAGGAMSPPADFAGDGGDYTRLIRARYRTDPARRQAMLILARRRRGSPQAPAVEIAGPWAAEARAILEKLGSAP